jgi:DNA-binding CsgD family transcriptional regulator
MTGSDHHHLRPVERRVLRWAEIGLDDAEIARRFGRSERWVAQVRFLADLDRSAPRDRPDMSDRSDSSDRPDDRLRPLERRLLRWRRAGARYGELSGRFRRSPEFLERVEDYARYKLAMT